MIRSTCRRAAELPYWRAIGTRTGTAPEPFICIGMITTKQRRMR
jgi:hypothetical protein